MLVLQQQQQGVIVSSQLSTSRRRSTSPSVYNLSLVVLSSSTILLFLLLLFNITFKLEITAVHAVNTPNYFSSKTTHQPNTRSKQQQRSSSSSSSHPWIKKSISLLQQPTPTTRQFLDQCVSFIDLLEIITIRGGGGGSGSNDNYYRHPPNQYDNNRNIDHNDNDHDYYSNPSPSQRRSSTRQRDDGVKSSFSNIPNMLQKVDRKTGLMLLVSGISVTFLGITLFFNKMIIRIGHLLCMAGILLSMGLSQTIQYFVQPEKLRATICLGIGIFLVFVGSPLFGIALEVFGILNLFGNMFPIVMVMIKQMPIIGTMLKSSTTSYNQSNRSRRRNDDDDDYYYNNDSRRQSRQQSSSPRDQYYDYNNRDEYGREEDNDGLGRRY